MKIQFLMDEFKSPYSGAESQLLILIEGLQRLGHECSLAVLRSSEYVTKNEFPCAVEILEMFRVAKLSSFMKLWKFAGRCRNNDFRVVHILLNDASVYAPAILKCFGIKVIVTRLDMGFWYTPGKLVILRLNRFFVDRVIANGMAVKNNVIENEKYRSEKVEVIYNGLRSPPAGKIKPVNLREALNIDADSVVIGIVASLYPIKRIRDLISAVALVREQIPNLHMVSIGGGDTALYANIAEDLGQTTHVHFVGPRPDPLAWIHSFDLTCLCSESEGFSNAILEYLGCGKPVICTRVGGNPEIIEHGVNGFLYEAGDVESLAAYITRLCVDEELRSQMAHAAGTSLDSRFTLTSFADSHLSLYRSML